MTRTCQACQVFLDCPVQRGTPNGDGWLLVNDGNNNLAGSNGAYSNKEGSEAYRNSTWFSRQCLLFALINQVEIITDVAFRGVFFIFAIPEGILSDHAAE